jgi:succinyl-CoA synthetase alpha subunit
MITLPQIRQHANKIVVFGEHPAIVQSMLDFDYLSGKGEGSILAIVTGRRGFAKYFFGRREFLIPTLVSLSGLEKFKLPKSTNLWFFNNLSGRRTLSSCSEAINSKSFAGGIIFAEGVPELHSLQLINSSDILIVGPASVGLLVPGVLKLGPIGGITPEQVDEGKLTEKGGVAVVSGSGGMTNELINVAVQAGHRLSFALSFGGDRFPVLSPRDAFLLAESDPQTKTVLYYGELGGEDEYELLKLKDEGQFSKQVVAHIAGTVSSLFPESPQFGHAKAKADKEKTTASAKRAALQSAGFQVSSSFTEFIQLVNKLK